MEMAAGTYLFPLVRMGWRQHGGGKNGSEAQWLTYKGLFAVAMVRHCSIPNNQPTPLGLNTT
jgi:hypothetical protein